MKKKISSLAIALVALMLMPMTVLAEKATPTMSFVNAEGATVSAVEATLGETFTSPTLTSDVREILRSVTYTSTNESVATVDTYSGNVTLVAAGTTMILANFNGNDDYYAARAMYDLTVKETTPPTPEPTCPTARYNLSSADNVLYLKVGDVVSIPELLGGDGSILRLSAKTIEGILVAELTEDDQIHAVGEGTATFFGLYFHANAATGSTLNCEYSFTISVEAAAPQKLDPQLSFSESDLYVELGDTIIPPAIINPNNILFSEKNCKWYTNWDSKVLSVNEQTGEVTILGVGDETISFEFTGNDTYKGTIISYTIHVTTTGLVVGGVTVTNANSKDVLHDGGSITYDPITHTLTMTNATINGNGLNLAPARIQNATADELPDAGILYTEKEPLKIVLIGSNAILNVDAGVFALNSAVVMMNDKENFGSIRINASTVAIKTQYYKIFKCYVTAIGGTAGVAVQEIGVATGANIVADGSLVAIEAKEFSKADDNEGVGIDILTEGVYFKTDIGFLNKENKIATHVEIGKVVVVPAATEVTTIDFTQTDPDGNETVVFSTSANGDGYNEETEQLEIVTTLTDAQVAEALESIVPGSSAWVSALPGSLTFDIPAGEGEIRIYCQTIPGYSLKLKIDGVAAVTLTTEDLNWVKVSYSVAVATHVVIYLHAESASAPARMAAMQNEEPAAGAYIKAVKIAPKDAPDPNPTTDIELTDEPSAIGNYKMIRNGQLYIVRDGKTYTATGAEIK